MTTIRQRRASRVNAKASTGPKTKAGKARSAANALPHGLTISVWNEPALALQVEAIALRIAGPNEEANALEWARRIAEAQVDLNRVRSLRRQAIARMLSDPCCDSSLEPMQRIRLISKSINLKTAVCVLREIENRAFCGAWRARPVGFQLTRRVSNLQL